MVFFRTLRCAQKHINYSTKQHFDEWRSNFYSLQSATKTLKKQSKIHFLGAETPPNRSSESCETLANGNKILAISTLPGVSGGAIHLPPTSHLAKKPLETITCSMICVVGKDPPSLPTSSNNYGNQNVFNDLGGGARVVVTTHLPKIL